MLDQSPPPASPEDYGARPPEPATLPDETQFNGANGSQPPDGLVEVPGLGFYDPAVARTLGLEISTAPYAGIPLSLDQWAYRELPPRDFLLGSVFTTTTRAMLSADTGIGKTHLAMAIAFSMAAGTGFCHWKGHRPANVLFVDGEMSRELLKERLADAERRLGKRPGRLYALCREDAEQMPPIDVEDGQDWLDGLLDYLGAIDGGLDFIHLDNVMSLTCGDLKEEEAWKPVSYWLQTLTKRRIGVLLVNHTGHDATRSYGTKTREWQLDTVILGEKVEDPEADLAMRLKFTKARQRRPETRDDYEAVVMRLKGDRWTSEQEAPERKRRQEDHALSILRQAIAEGGEKIPGLPADVRGVSTDLWKKYCETYNLSSSDKASSRERAFDRARKMFLDKKIIKSKLGKIWIIQ